MTTWVRRDDYVPDERFLNAFMRGEITKGGMAEAGWEILRDDDCNTNCVIWATGPLSNRGVVGPKAKTTAE